MEKKQYVKMGELVDRTFTIEKVWGYQWQMWDNENKKMLKSDKWEKGYRKTYDVVTDKGQVTMSAGQLGQCLEAVSDKGLSNLIGRTIEVGSNGKTGIDIRYFFTALPAHAVKQQQPEEEALSDDEEEQITMQDIPF